MNIKDSNSDSKGTLATSDAITHPSPPASRTRVLPANEVHVIELVLHTPATTVFILAFSVCTLAILTSSELHASCGVVHGMRSTADVASYRTDSDAAVIRGLLLLLVVVVVSLGVFALRLRVVAVVVQDGPWLRADDDVVEATERRRGQGRGKPSTQPMPSRWKPHHTIVSLGAELLLKKTTQVIVKKKQQFNRAEFIAEIRPTELCKLAEIGNLVVNSSINRRNMCLMSCLLGHVALSTVYC